MWRDVGSTPRRGQVGGGGGGSGVRVGVGVGIGIGSMLRVVERQVSNFQAISHDDELFSLSKDSFSVESEENKA